MNDIKYTVLRLEQDDFLNNSDENLISTFEVTSNFNTITDKVELHFYSIADNQLLYSEYDYNSFNVERNGSTDTTDISTISVDPVRDSNDYGYRYGDVVLHYNFTRDLFSNNRTTSEFFLEEISADRTELKLVSLDLSNKDLLNRVQELKSIFNTPYTERLNVNFLNNEIFPFINYAYFEEQERGYLLLKLYEPLSELISVKQKCSVVEFKTEPVRFQVTTEFIPVPETRPKLRGPNFSSYVSTGFSNPTDYVSKQDLEIQIDQENYKTYNLGTRNDLLLGINYSDYNNFLHFSSAEQRLKNFKYKLDTLGGYQASRSLAETLSDPITSTERVKFYENKITEILENFSHYDRFLYFESSSFSWPKSGSAYPYIPQSSNTVDSINFYNSQLISASLFDDVNIHRLINTIPSFLKDDPNNEPYNIFLDMIGEHFDNIWIYSKQFSDKYDGDNRLEYGISRDLVAEALKNFGMKIYGSDLNFESLFNMFTGEFYVTGSEQITNFITGSNLPVPKDDYQKEIYKRLYHNLPFLTKSKGTEKSIRGLINIFGVPSQSLDVKYYGGIYTDVDPFYGPFTSITGSENRILLDNTGSIIDGNTLSYYTNISEEDKKYTDSLHLLEIGFSPFNDIDRELTSAFASFDIDDYIGDPRRAFDNSYYLLDKVLSSYTNIYFANRYNLYDYVRLLKFYDNTLFKMIKDFTPARTNTLTGLVIKPNILNRSKIKQPELKWSRYPVTSHLSSSLDFTGSYYEGNFIFQGNKNVVNVDGGNGGGFLSGSLTGSYNNPEFIKEYSTVYSYQNILPSGGYDTVINRDEAKYTGVFPYVETRKNGVITYEQGGIHVSKRDLNSDNVFKRGNLKLKSFYINLNAPGATELPKPSPSPTPTSTVTPTVTPSITPSVTVTPSITATSTSTPTVTPTPSSTPPENVTPSPTPTNSITPSITPTNTVTPSVTSTTNLTPTPTPSVTPSITATPSNTVTPTPSITPTSTITPTVTVTPSNTITPTPTVTATPTPTPVLAQIVINSITYNPLFDPPYTINNSSTGPCTDFSPNLILEYSTDQVNYSDTGNTNISCNTGGNNIGIALPYTGTIYLRIRQQAIRGEETLYGYSNVYTYTFPSPTPTPTQTVTPSITATPSNTVTPTPSITPTTTVTSSPTPTPSTTPPVSYFFIQTGYDASVDANACDEYSLGIYTTVYGNNTTLATSTAIYADSGGTISATAGRYSDGIKAYNWNGSSFVSSTDC